MADFQLFKNKILDIEGGYQNNPADRGNYNRDGELVGTNFGIAAFTYEKWYGETATESAMKNLTRDEALEIFEGHFWLRNRIDEIDDQQIAEIICDGIINHGTGSRTKKGGVHLAQVALNELGENLTVDGALGSKTLATINRQIEIQKGRLFNRYRALRIEYYHAIVDSKPSQSVFLQGWLKRMDEFPTLPETPLVIVEPPSLPERIADEATHILKGLPKIIHSPSARREWALIGAVICVSVFVSLASISLTRR